MTGTTCGSLSRLTIYLLIEANSYNTMTLNKVGQNFHRNLALCRHPEIYQGEVKVMSWNDPDKEDTTIYKVVVNHEEQYSIWPEYKQNPPGWKNVGKVGPKAECLAHI